MQLLKGKKALITGGSRGIGFAIARRFAECGADIALFGTNSERGHKAAEELKNTGQKVFFFQADVSNEEQTLQGIESASECLGGIDILVNNAGITKDGLLMKMKKEDWQAVLDVNLNSIFYTSKAVIRAMMKAREGRIINISSVVGLMGNAGQTNYAASKAGIIGFTKALAKEVGARNITVNCIAPGFITTDMTEALTEAQKGQLLAQIPLGRLGAPEEIADAALFLASPLASYITGQTLTVDGGMVMS